MGVADKFSNKAEGQADQGSAGLKQGAEKLKDKANEAASKITGNN